MWKRPLLRDHNFVEHFFVVEAKKRKIVSIHLKRSYTCSTKLFVKSFDLYGIISKLVLRKTNTYLHIHCH